MVLFVVHCFVSCCLEIVLFIVFVCVFRHPGVTINSILKECKRENYLKDLRINQRIASDVWNLQYRHILDIHRKYGDWCFVHYDQILNGDGFKRIQNITGAEINHQFPDCNLKRSYELAIDSNDVMDTYKELCNLASYFDHG